ncbi:TetR family transcriptional regulator C-terminal domain-containing protein [Moritella sp. 24]|uniref:TetR/AcrR family transcriptional regulator n=1 Tax=Moritella sp. 24 TaxID=2746230 RepID=UPI001BA4B602|nr:TetR/AcrR family transcriptional regulator [Moritella sp. 24]QUM75857.1 TetR family transcriptional regulator C-terminal domain-containing protein [Moritella sp. 24]
MSTIRKKNEGKILKAASQVFASEGYAATKTIDIAKLAGVPKANVYYYFGNKETLYTAVLETIIEPLLSATHPMITINDPAVALTEYIKTKLLISRDYPYASKVFANEIMRGSPLLSPEIRQRLMNQSTFLLDKFTQWIDAGQMDNVSPHHLLFMIWSSTQTYADFSWQINAVMGKTSLTATDYEDAAHLISQLVLKGCNVKSSSDTAKVLTE